MAQKKNNGEKDQAALLAALLKELEEDSDTAAQEEGDEEGVSHKMRVSCPCTKAEAAKIQKILLGLRDLPYEHLVVELEPNPTRLDCIQTIVEKDGAHLMVEVFIASGTDDTHIFRASSLTRAEGIEVFLDLCYRAKVPSGKRWRDVTEEVLG